MQSTDSLLILVFLISIALALAFDIRCKHKALNIALSVTFKTSDWGKSAT